VSARIIDGKALAQKVRARIADDVARLRAEHGIQPGLAAVLVGEDPASQVYVGMKHRATEAAGMLSRQVVLPADTSQEDLEALVARAQRRRRDRRDPRPAPAARPPRPAAGPGADRAAKDVDALNPYTAGRLAVGDPTFLSCTPYGVLELLAEAGVDTVGADVVIVGRSNLVGRPLSNMLTLKGRDATVTLAHSRTRDLPGGLPWRRRPRRRRRRGRARHGRHGQARRGRHRRRDQPHRRRQARRGRRLRRRSPRSPARSPRSPGGSDP
jgi:methylenetetrahydrofolate dehydrogenase (NADP+) / methenyltetrahydrofolate cyclohydrolase